MITDTNSQQTGVLSVDEKKEKGPHKREIPKLFYSDVTWKLASSRELNEEEINEVISRIGGFYSQFLKEREKELVSFGYELEICREPLASKGKDSSEFKLQVKLISPTYIPTKSFDPPVLFLP
ncbi:MAG TPA: hypothetical protein VNS58_15965 [Puia sp.]|nr:hypothetical protein [Puia sp.]